MSGFIDEIDAGIQMPWDVEPQRFLAGVRKQIPYSTIVVGIINSQRPRPDEILVASGCDGQQLIRWCETDMEQNSIYRAARRNGVATSESTQITTDEHLPMDDQYVLMFALPGSISPRRWWWVMFGRSDQPFSQMEQQLAASLLRQWQVSFDHVEEGGTGRLLIGHDDRLIHSDPWISALLLKEPGMLDHLVKQMHPIVSERWPDLPDRVMHDYAIELADSPYWICFHRGRALDDARATHWFLEMHPLQPGDLPLVGSVEDDRIARAIAYLHDNYPQTPSLAEVAKHVHVSPFHFHRLFSKQVGVSPKHYLQSKQLQVAKWLLRSSRIPIGSIATRTGFASHGHFTSTFHRLIGVSPSEYRGGTVVVADMDDAAQKPVVATAE